MAACPLKSVHFQVAEGHTIGLPFSWLLLLGQATLLSGIIFILPIEAEFYPDSLAFAVPFYGRFVRFLYVETG